MAMTILYEGVKNSLHDLEDAAFTQINHTGSDQKDGNTTLSSDTPLGVLGGSVASMKGSRTVGAFEIDDIPVGLFLNDATGNPYENTPGIASGKGVFLHGQGEVEVDVYETVSDDATPVALTYAVGEYLYGSPNGLLTNENSGSNQVAIGVVTKVPTASDPTLGVLLII